MVSRDERIKQPIILSVHEQLLSLSTKYMYDDLIIFWTFSIESYNKMRE